MTRAPAHRRPGTSRGKFGTFARMMFAVPVAVLAALVLAPPAQAHPLGNFTVNSYSGLSVQPRAVLVEHVVDYAEIPTIQRFPDAKGEGTVADGVAQRYAAGECGRLRPGLRLRLDGIRQALQVRSSRLEFVPGQAGLPTMRLTCELSTGSDVETTDHRLQYVDVNSLDRTGWREITVSGDGVTLADSTVPAESISSALSSYPEDLLSSPLDERSASTVVRTGDGTVSGLGSAATSGQSAARDGGSLTDRFTALVSARDLGLGFALGAAALSVLLGAAHAFAPGHGKTLMAAYLLGQRKSLRQVGVIGLTVTLTHTAGVLVLGVVLSAVALTAPERIYGWLGVASGVLLVGVGASLLRQARRRLPAAPRQRAAELVHANAAPVREHGQVLVDDPGPPHVHHHDQVDDHDHHDHHHDHHHEHGHDHGVTHSHGWGGTHTHPPVATSARSMVAVGFVGGMVPSPSALIVLLGGIALGRTWFGILLVLAYGIGMALALIGTGLALAHARDHVERWASRRRSDGEESSRLMRLTRLLPATTAALVIVVGVGLAIRSALTL